jgi:hypothetical protein
VWVSWTVGSLHWLSWEWGRGWGGQTQGTSATAAGAWQHPRQLQQQQQQVGVRVHMPGRLLRLLLQLLLWLAGSLTAL